MAAAPLSAARSPLAHTALHCIDEAKAYIADLEAQGAQLDRQLNAKAFVLARLRGVFELEMAAVASVEPVELDHPALPLVQHLVAGRFASVLDSRVAHELLGPRAAAESHQGLLRARISVIRERCADDAVSIVIVGAALLQAFVQANWTGPPLALDALYPLAYEREGAADPDPLVSAAAAANARAQSASSGKDAAPVDAFPYLHAQCARRLEASGEPVYPYARLLHLLATAKDVFDALGDCTISSAWWGARCAVVHHETLETRNTAGSLKRQANERFAAAARRLEGESAELRARLQLEWGTACHKLGDETGAKRAFLAALATLELQVSLSGALGKRTKFQVEQKTQLIVLAKSATTTPADDAPHAQIPRVPKDDNDFGTVVEAGVPTVQITELDEHTPLRERLLLSAAASAEDDLARRGRLSLLDQTTLLALCEQVKHGYAMEPLTAEEMLAYVARVTEHPDNWTVHSSALFTKSLLEFERYKTKERAALQLQVLVDQQTDRLTVLQPTVELAAGKPVTERQLLVHALAWPPVWRLKRTLGDKYMELGVMASALKLFEELCMWEEAVNCLLRMDLKSRAENLIRERLAVRPSANLWCCLGDVLEDHLHYHTAWEVSQHRFARAQRLLGVAAFERNDFVAAAQHLKLALDINPQFSSSWFRLGACALKAKDWQLARTAYANVVSIEPEDGDAWANLCAVLVQLGEMDQALRAIGEATKFANLNWRIWDSFVTVALQCGEWDQALHGMDTLLDIGARRADAQGKKVDARALIMLVDGVVHRLGELDADAAARMQTRVEAYLTKLKAKADADADVWVAVCMYHEAMGQREALQDALLKRCRALMTDAWFKDESRVRQVAVTAARLDPVAAKTFVQGVLQKAVLGGHRTLNDVVELARVHALVVGEP